MENITIENISTNDNSNQLVLVTGGSGFIGAYCIMHLIKAGYQVRTTVRSLNREAGVREMLKSAGCDPGEKLTFVAADLLSNKGWKEAVADCKYVMHVASPFPSGVPKNEDDLIIPAREGALRVLRASRDEGVKRVVMTSSFAAIGYGQEIPEKPFTEEDWTNPDGKKVGAYIKSKTLAEKAAWEFIMLEGGVLELSTINPVGVLGPVLGADYSSSIQIIKRLLDGSMPGCPRISFGTVDVRDVADLHLRAMITPEAKGERFLAVAGQSISMPEMASLLREKMGNAARRVPSVVFQDWIVRLFSLFDKEVAQVVIELGNVKEASNEKARRMLGWNPRSNEEAILATAVSLINLGIIKV
jgi:nucleoside-diphosphate-sugar epimerase